jgi:hypothetical protein
MLMVDMATLYQELPIVKTDLPMSLSRAVWDTIGSCPVPERWQTGRSQLRDVNG